MEVNRRFVVFVNQGVFCLVGFLILILPDCARETLLMHECISPRKLDHEDIQKEEECFSLPFTPQMQKKCSTGPIFASKGQTC